MAKNWKWTQYAVPLANEPGALAKLTKALSGAGVNITGFTTEGSSDVGWFRFLSEDANIKPVLERAGYQAFAAPAIEIELPNKAGELHQLAKSFADKGVNILHIYGTTTVDATRGRIVVVVDHPEKIQPVITKLNGHVVKTR